MPVEPCREGGKPGFRAGPNQKCFTYTAGNASSRGRARGRAQAQFVRIGLEQQRRGEPSELGTRQLANVDALFDAEFWRELRATMTRRVMPAFRESFMVGAALGANERPSRRRQRSIVSDYLDVVIGIRQEITPPGGTPELPFDFEAVLGASDDIIEGYTDRWWVQFEQTTQDGLRASIQRAAANDLGVEAVIDDIAPLFGEARARRIAVSEVTNLMGQGAQETYRRAGFAEWEWRTVRDARVDPICQRLRGRRFPISVPFQRAHPNCRCFPVPAGQPGTQVLPRGIPSGLNFPGSFAA